VLALKKLLANGWGGALLMEPRTGKTKVAIDYMSILHMSKGVNRVLMIGPVVAIEVWKEQLKDNCPFPYRLTIWDSKGRKQQELPSYGKDILDIVLMNYDALSTPGKLYVNKNGDKVRSKTRGGRYEVKEKIKRWQPQLIILDESVTGSRARAPRSLPLYTRSDPSRSTA
jgi:hypothetical protein